MTTWRPTAALGRAAGIGTISLVMGLAMGRPMLVVLATPFLIHAAVGLWHRPSADPHVQARLGVTSLHEGQATSSILSVDAATTASAELITRSIGRTAYLAVAPESGTSQTLVSPPQPASPPHRPSAQPDPHAPQPDPRDPQPDPSDAPAPLTLAAHRWGNALLAEEKVAIDSPWSGFVWGPHPLPRQRLTVLPQRTPDDASAPAPHPVGLVGAHRSSRPGSGTEFASIRPFTIGDRLKRIHWRHTLRTGELQTVISDAAEDAAVLLILDAQADIGRSGGVDGAATSLDVAVRAAAATAEHHLRLGDRVGLRVLSSGGAIVPIAAGTAQTHRILGSLARIKPSGISVRERARLTLRAPVGSVVVVFTPLLDDLAAQLAVLAVRAGHDVVVVDTMPADADPALDAGTPPTVAALAWRLRRLDRGPIRRALEREGCAVVTWQGPSTLGHVLRGMSRTRTRMVRR